MRRREGGKEGGGERGDYSTERQEEEEEEVRKKKKRPSSLSKENQLLNVVSANRGGKRRSSTDSARIYRLGILGFSLEKSQFVILKRKMRVNEKRGERENGKAMLCLLLLPLFLFFPRTKTTLRKRRKKRKEKHRKRKKEINYKGCFRPLETTEEVAAGGDPPLLLSSRNQLPTNMGSHSLSLLLPPPPPASITNFRANSSPNSLFRLSPDLFLLERERERERERRRGVSCKSDSALSLSPLSYNGDWNGQTQRELCGERQSLPQTTQQRVLFALRPQRPREKFPPGKSSLSLSSSASPLRSPHPFITGRRRRQPKRRGGANLQCTLAYISRRLYCTLPPPHWKYIN